MFRRILALFLGLVLLITPLSSYDYSDALAEAVSTDTVTPSEAQGTMVPSEPPLASEAPKEELIAEETPLPTAEPTTVPLVLKLRAEQRYVFANEEAIRVSVLVGGEDSISYCVYANGEQVAQGTARSDENGAAQIEYMPTVDGMHTVKVFLSDAEGASVEKSVEIPVAARETETKGKWEAKIKRLELSGDWREDLLAVAETQIGYRESTRDFVIDEDGQKHGYTRYGDWYGSAYSDWCAMFISFCLHYAGIDEADFPQEANCYYWKKALLKLDAWEDAQGYEPSRGDLVFFNAEEEDDPEHVGIVEAVEGGKIYTIEGNMANAVVRKEYMLDDATMVGFANISALMERAGILPTAAPEETEAPAVTQAPVEAAAPVETEAPVATPAEPESTPVPEAEPTAAPEQTVAPTIAPTQAPAVTPSEPQPTAEPAKGAMGQLAYTATDIVNLRAEPNTKSNRLGQIHGTGSAVVILESSEQSNGIWYLVRFGPQSAWILGSLLRLTGEEAEAEPTAQKQGLLTGVTNTDYVTLFKGPYTTTSRLARLDTAGAAVVIRDQITTNGMLWYELQYGSLVLYVQAEKVDVSVPEQAQDIAPAVEVTSNEQNVQTAEGQSANIALPAQQETALVQESAQMTALESPAASETATVLLGAAVQQTATPSDAVATPSENTDETTGEIDAPVVTPSEGETTPSEPVVTPSEGETTPSEIATPSDGSLSYLIALLIEQNRYYNANAYYPVVEDTVFLDTDGDGTADAMGTITGVVAEYIPAMQSSLTGGAALLSEAADVAAQTEATVYLELDVTLTDEDGQEQQTGYSYVLCQMDGIIVGFGRNGENANQDEIDALVNAIAQLDVDQIMADLEALCEAGDEEAEMAHYREVGGQVKDLYFDYILMDEILQPFVTNSQVLYDLEWLWSISLLLDNIVSDAPTAIASASTSEFVDLNLYDYGSNINTNYKSSNKYPGFQWNGGAYCKGSSYDRNVVDYIDFGNSLITDFDYGSSSNGTNGKSSNAQMIGMTNGNNGAINKLDYSTYGVTNRPIGMSLNSSITDTSEDVLQRTLGSDGYPALKDGTSLSYLFTSGSYATKKNTSSIDGLFQQNATSGEYYYNSRWNHAQYSNNKFTLYNQIITPNFIVYPFGNFLPFNDITDSSNATQVGKITNMGNYVDGIINDLHKEDSTEQQLIYMLGCYKENVQVNGINGKTWDTFSAKDAIIDYFRGGDADADNPSNDTSQITDALLNKMYNIDWDVDTNFFFGMDMTMNFIQPKGGMTGNDTNGDGESDYEMVFYFTGDDDVWIYIDGVLFLDLSGIHRHVGGKIDFVNGKVHYYYLDTENTGDVSSTPYQTYTFAEILSAAGKSTDGLNSNGTFADYTTHQFKFYYMERGSGSSVCRLNFNFPLLRQNSISVSKEVAADTAILGNPEYSFQVLKADSSGNRTNELFIAAETTYTIYDANDNVIGTGTTDANGVFKLKAGQRAEFTGIKENAGKYYVRELLEGTVLEQYGNVTVSGETTTTSNNVTVGSDMFTGMDSPVKNISDGATVFRFTNDVDEEKLATLSVSKAVTSYTSETIDETYEIEVKLDGELLPVGTKYTVGSKERIVEEAGIIKIKANETATIASILAGTAFSVQETSGSATGYTVSYSTEEDTVEINDGTVTGTLKTEAQVVIQIGNVEKSIKIPISITKTLSNPDGTERTFRFRIVELEGANGEEKEDGLTATSSVTLSGASASQELWTILYGAKDEELAILPATFYYRITEVAGSTNTMLYDTSAYLLTVVLSSDGSGGLKADTMLTKDGAEAAAIEFTNTLLGNLTISKTVTGAAEGFDREFTFRITLTNSNDTPLSGTFGGIAFDANGQAEITLKRGQTLTITGIPVGTRYTVQETEHDGYNVEVNGSQTDTASGQIVAHGSTVAYTNHTTYALPETGGPGMHMYTMGGLLLCAGALLLYSQKNRRREGANR